MNYRTVSNHKSNAVGQAASAAPEPADALIRINKYLSAHCGVSRRAADTLINQGRVTVNGSIAQPGLKVSSSDTILLDQQVIAAEPAAPVYLALNKPRGIICTTDRRVNDNISDFLDYPERIYPIGRLDRDSEGLLLLTNDGSIVNQILRARFMHEKEYEVTVQESITPAFIKSMRQPVPILGTLTQAAKVRQIDEHRFRIILTQGLNRQIRRMCEYFQYHVCELRRLRIMNITLGTLKPGQWRYLSHKELQQLDDLLQRSLKDQGRDLEVNQYDE
ncbi:pseudouridine synthase [Oscillospiraceae bacterium HV4-5-C5C]|nr:pseudouridine synthase [Oscillospiraceae bacterium HV4-5-C5C]